MSKTWILLVALTVLAAGCAWTPQAILVKPEIEVQPSTVGNGRPVVVKVEDERPKTTLGTRGVRGVGAELTLQGNFAEIIHAALIDGLKRQGFDPTESSTVDNRELRVEIRGLEYQVTQGFWSGTLRTDCALKATCVVGSARPYEHLYRAEYEESIAFVKGDEENKKYINDIVSKALNQLLSDEKLIKCLATAPSNL
jgi:uncharacterized lipoprotein